MENPVQRLDRETLEEIFRLAKATKTTQMQIEEWYTSPTNGPIPPALLEVLESRGFVRDMKWTEEGIAWLNGDIDKA